MFCASDRGKRCRQYAVSMLYFSECSVILRNPGYQCLRVSVSFNAELRALSLTPSVVVRVLAQSRAGTRCNEVFEFRDFEQVLL
jgi:hypothetical protein